jgi:phosphatidylinositol 4-phosphatase
VYKSKYVDEYVKNIIELLQSGDFYFSYTTDLSISMQKKNQSKPKATNAHQYSDKRFFWNKFISSNLLKEAKGIENWIPVLVYGSVKAEVCYNEKLTHHFNFVLFSRRSCQRVGTRYRKRGIDMKGHVANYVEIEQIVETPQTRVKQKTAFIFYINFFIFFIFKKSSYVIVRGSVPIFWMQCDAHPLIFNPNIRLLHKKEKKVLTATKIHLESMREIYGYVHIVNLLSSHPETIGSDQEKQECYYKLFLFFIFYFCFIFYYLFLLFILFFFFLLFFIFYFLFFFSKT